MKVKKTKIRGKAGWKLIASDQGIALFRPYPRMLVGLGLAAAVAFWQWEYLREGLLSGEGIASVLIVISAFLAGYLQFRPGIFIRRWEFRAGLFQIGFTPIESLLLEKRSGRCFLVVNGQSHLVWATEDDEEMKEVFSLLEDFLGERLPSRSIDVD